MEYFSSSKMFHIGLDSNNVCPGSIVWQSTLNFTITGPNCPNQAQLSQPPPYSSNDEFTFVTFKTINTARRACFEYTWSVNGPNGVGDDFALFGQCQSCLGFTFDHDTDGVGSSGFTEQDDYEEDEAENNVKAGVECFSVFTNTWYAYTHTYSHT